MPVASRLTNTGILYANGIFDEVAQSTISVESTVLYAAEFDEVTLNGQASPQRRELSTGVVQVNGYFDEYTWNPNIVTSGLVLYVDTADPNSYPGSGTVWYDLSGNGNNGTLVNGASYNATTGGISTNGTNSYMSFPGSSISSTITTAVTMSCFMYLTSTTLFGGIAGYNNPGNPGQLFSFQVRNSNVSPAVVYFTLYTTSGYIGGSTGTGFASVSFNQWNCVSATYDGTNIKVFLNGTRIATDTASGAFSSSAQGIFLGSDVTRARYAAGSWNSFQIYNRALSEAEIKQNFDALRDSYGI
jgi:hypothetical protein